MTLVVEARVKASFSLCEISSGAPGASGCASRATSDSLTPAFCSAAQISDASGGRVAALGVALGAGGAVLVEAATGTAERSPAAGAGVCAHAATTSPADAASAATLRQHGARRGVDLLMN